MKGLGFWWKYTNKCVKNNRKYYILYKPWRNNHYVTFTVYLLTFKTKSVKIVIFEI